MLRLSVEAGGCSGFQYVFQLDDKRNPDDMYDLYWLQSSWINALVMPGFTSFIVFFFHAGFLKKRVLSLLLIIFHMILSKVLQSTMLRSWSVPPFWLDISFYDIPLFPILLSLHIYEFGLSDSISFFSCKPDISAYWQIDHGFKQTSTINFKNNFFFALYRSFLFNR